MSEEDDVGGRLNSGGDEDVDFGEDDGEDRDEFVSERNVGERASKGDPFSQFFEKEEPGDAKEHVTWVKQLSKKERFFYTLREVVAECSENIEKIDKIALVEKIKNTEGLEYKNPWGFILGYLASNGGKKLEKKRVLYIMGKVPPSVQKEYGIEKPDIVRYARYWNTYL